MGQQIKRLKANQPLLKPLADFIPKTPLKQVIARTGWHTKYSLKINYIFAYKYLQNTHLK